MRDGRDARARVGDEAEALFSLRLATDEDAHCYHYDGTAREGCANANATDDAALARPLACNEAPAAPYSPDATDAGDDGMERLCACSFGPTASPTPLPTVSPLPTPRPSPVPTSVPTSVPTYRPTNYRTQKLGPFAPARDTTVRLGNTQVINPASGALQCRRGTNNEYVALLQWDIAPLAAELAASKFTAHGLAYATVALRVAPRAVNNTLSVHALAANFPKCCWEADAGSWNISG